MVAFFLTSMTLVVLGLLFFPRTYKSDARLFVRLGKESVGLDPTAALQQTVSVNDSRESEINSVVELLRSRAVLDDVVKRLGADEILGTQPGESTSWLQMVKAPADIARTWLYGNIGAEERAVARLEKAITIGAPRRSNVVLVSAQARDPQLAQRILQALIESYTEQHVDANRTEGSHAFFVTQSDLLQEQLRRANEEVRDARNASSLVSIDGERQNVQSQATSIEAAILANQRDLAASDARIAALKRQLEELPHDLVAEQTAGLPNQAADAMRNELYRLQIEEKDISSRFTSLHPSVIAIRRQVAETQKIFDEQQDSRSQTTRRPSVVHQHVQTELSTATALAASQRAAAASLEQQFDAVRSRMRSLNDNEFRIAELSRKAELLETTYRTYVRNREQARIDQELASGRISNINVVQPATIVAKPSSPRVMLTLAMGLFASTFGAVLLAFVAEHFDRSLKTQEQIEHELGIPVLFSVPRSRGHELLPH
ncbi:MAG: GumC family protein [Pirellulales bacterium]